MNKNFKLAPSPLILQRLRNASFYIRAYQNKRFVISINQEQLTSSLIEDLALLASLNMRVLVLVACSTSGYLRLEKLIEQFMRKQQQAQLLAKAIDFKLAKINPTDKSSQVIKKIDRSMQTGKVAVYCLSGSNPSRQALSQRVLSTFQFASSIAVGLGASKLICQMPQQMFAQSFAMGSQFDVAQAKHELAQLVKQRGQIKLLECAIEAIEAKVPRVHFLPDEIDGGLLLELLSPEGIGMMIFSFGYDTVCWATKADLPKIEKLLVIGEKAGQLCPRNKSEILARIKNYLLLYLDNQVVALAAYEKIKVPPKVGKRQSSALILGPIIVDEPFRGRGLGGNLVLQIEQTAKNMKCDRLYLVSELSANWFVRLGFSKSVKTQATYLPESYLRQMKVRKRLKLFVKLIG